MRCRGKKYMKEDNLQIEQDRRELRESKYGFNLGKKPIKKFN